jgi:arsenate reductase
MKEIGIDISNQKPKALNFDMSGRFDYIITMGCVDTCPITPKEKTIEWSIEDPRNKGDEKFREVRDIIKEKVQELMRN